MEITENTKTLEIDANGLILTSCRITTPKRY